MVPVPAGNQSWLRLEGGVTVAIRTHSLGYAGGHVPRAKQTEAGVWV